MALPLLLVRDGANIQIHDDEMQPFLKNCLSAAKQTNDTIMCCTEVPLLDIV